MSIPAAGIPAARRRGGFSLIELLIVVSILGITAAMAAPKLLQAGAATDVRSAQSVLATTISRARAIAVQRGRTTRVYFGGTRSWVVATDASGTATLVGDTIRLDALFKVTGVVQNPTNGSRMIEFDPRGVGTQSGATIQVDLTRDAGHTGQFCAVPSGVVLREGCGS